MHNLLGCWPHAGICLHAIMPELQNIFWAILWRPARNDKLILGHLQTAAHACLRSIWTQLMTLTSMALSHLFSYHIQGSTLSVVFSALETGAAKLHPILRLQPQASSIVLEMKKMHSQAHQLRKHAHMQHKSCIVTVTATHTGTL